MGGEKKAFSEEKRELETDLTWAMKKKKTPTFINNNENTKNSFEI